MQDSVCVKRESEGPTVHDTICSTSRQRNVSVSTTIVATIDTVRQEFFLARMSQYADSAPRASN